MNKIKELEKKILDARDHYYNSDTPIMSDKAFDALFDELKKLDPNNKAITMVGAPLRPSEWKKAKHLLPLGSLDKINKPEELTDWILKHCPNDAIFVVEKLDGLSIELIYEQGKFIQAITRGAEGIEGEDITVNVVQMGGVISSLKDSFTGSLRGEIIMTKTNHKKYFAEKVNLRNAASGVSKRLNGVDVDKLDVLCYQAVGDIEFANEQEQFAWLKTQQFKMPNFWLFDTSDEVNKHWRKYQDVDRAKLDYDIDGLVIRVSDMQKQLAFGSKNLRPHGAIAMKFDNESCETTLIDVIWETGAMGRITPIAILEPVLVSGATIKRATLHNMARVKELALYKGCKVLVSRRNDVIPFIEAKC